MQHTDKSMIDENVVSFCENEYIKNLINNQQWEKNLSEKVISLLLLIMHSPFQFLIKASVNIP